MMIPPWLLFAIAAIVGTIVLATVYANASELTLEPYADLPGADLRGVNLNGIDLAYANLSRADLTGVYTNIDYGPYDGTVKFQFADLSGANLTNSRLIKAKFQFADLSGANLQKADLGSAYLTGANLSGADLRGADLTYADLTSVDLTGATLDEAALHFANFTGADLTNTSFGWKPRSYFADLSGVDLTFSFVKPELADPANPNTPDNIIDISGADITRVDLRGANSSRAYFALGDTGGSNSNVQLAIVNLTAADLQGAGLTHDEIVL